MNPGEAKQQAMDLLADTLSLDAFQRIAVQILMDDIGELDFPNVTPEQERKLMELGSVVTGKRGSL